MSPFLDSGRIKPLYDVLLGGPPRGFECQLDIPLAINHKCKRVTRTLSGMKTHQRIVHGIKDQLDMEYSFAELKTTDKLV